jgi:hypothetical protein
MTSVCVLSHCLGICFDHVDYNMQAEGFHLSVTGLRIAVGCFLIADISKLQEHSDLLF